MRTGSRYGYAIAAWAFVAAIVVQVFLAGSALLNLGGSGSFASHVEFGYSIGVVALVLLISAIAARPGRREVGIVLGLVILYVVQTSLPFAKTSMPAIAALHPVTAMFLFLLAVWIARRATKLARATA